ncbi:MAG: PIN domain-containing protein [Actinomycetota bacterium]
MTGSRGFVDTNVLVYAHDITAGTKRDRARSLLAALWESGEGCLSVQVLQEFFVTATRRVPKPLDEDAAGIVVADLSRWRVHSPGPEDVLSAIDIHRRNQVSLWDAMIIRSAGQLGCGVLYSEDLSDGQRYEGVRVQDPFATD